MHNPQRGPRPRLTGEIIKFALVDVVGMVLLALGLAFLARGPGVFFAAFPSTTLEAVALTGAGVALMGYAAVRILREVMKQQGRLEE